MTQEQRNVLEALALQFRMQRGRDMTPDDCQFAVWWRSGEIAVDEPPGLSERDYQLWLFLGGKVNPPRVVTQEDL